MWIQRLKASVNWKRKEGNVFMSKIKRLRKNNEQQLEQREAVGRQMFTLTMKTEGTGLKRDEL